MNDHNLGLYEKFYVARLNDERGKHSNCDYFVLDLVHDSHAKAALLAYAQSCEMDYPQLARDLIERCGYMNGDTADDYGS